MAKSEKTSSVEKRGDFESVQQYFSIFEKFGINYFAMAQELLLERTEPEKAAQAETYGQVFVKQVTGAKDIVIDAFHNADPQTQQAVALLIESSGVLVAGSEGIRAMSTAVGGARMGIWQIVIQILEILKELLPLIAELFSLGEKIIKIIHIILEILDKIVEFLSQLFGGAAALMAQQTNETMWRNLQYYYETEAARKRANGELPYIARGEAKSQS